MLRTHQQSQEFQKNNFSCSFIAFLSSFFVECLFRQQYKKMGPIESIIQKQIAIFIQLSAFFQTLLLHKIKVSNLGQQMALRFTYLFAQLLQRARSRAFSLKCARMQEQKLKMLSNAFCMFCSSSKRNSTITLFNCALQRQAFGDTDFSFIMPVLRCFIPVSR